MRHPLSNLRTALLFCTCYLLCLSSANLSAQPNLDAVHPELRPVAEKIMGFGKTMPEFNSENLAKIRAVNFPTPPRLDDISVSKQTLAATPTAPAVDVYVINSETGKQRPAIVHTHGGGFVTGKAEGDLSNLQRLAKLLDATIVTVDYSLAPEADYTVSVAQNYAALQWLYKNSQSLGVDRNRIAVMGESAGGGHAALLAIKARDEGEIPLVLQVLIYPMLDDRTGSSKPVPESIGKMGWGEAQNRFGWQSFLGQRPGTRKVPAAAVPARTKSLAGLPPTFIAVGDIDLFVLEDIEYAKRLIETGIATELMVVPGAFHGFDVIAPETNVSKALYQAKVNALKNAFAQ